MLSRKKKYSQEQGHVQENSCVVHANICIVLVVVCGQIIKCNRPISHNAGHLHSDIYFCHFNQIDYFVLNILTGFIECHISILVHLPPKKV